MRSLKLLTLFILLLLVLVPLLSCGKGESEKTESGSGSDSSSDRPPVVLEPEDTAPTIVPSPSLGSEDEIEELGFTANGIILSAARSNGAGAIFDGLNSQGRPLWKASPAEVWAVRPNVAIPEGFPTLVVPVGTEVTVCDRIGYEISSDSYVDFSTAQTYAPDALPEGAGVYIRMITVSYPKPKDAFDSIERGAFFGEIQYFLVVSFE